MNERINCSVYKKWVKKNDRRKNEKIEKDGGWGGEEEDDRQKSVVKLHARDK